MPQSKSRTRTRAEELAESVELAINDRGLKTDDWYATRQSLQASSGMARATVNEAVRILIDRGVVYSKPGPGGGLFAALETSTPYLRRALVRNSTSTAAVRDANEVREALEPMVVTQAARFCTSNDGDQLLNLVAEVEACSTANEFVVTVWNLQRKLAAIGRNETLKAAYRDLLNFIESDFQTHASAVGHTRDDDRRTERNAARRQMVTAIIEGKDLIAIRAVSHLRRL